MEAVSVASEEYGVYKVLDDLAEGKSHDGEIVTAQTQDRNTDQNAENGSNGSADKDGDHKTYGRIDHALHALGKEVIYLKRIRIGSIVLDPTLEEGTYRRLTAGEVAALEKNGHM